MRESRPDRLFTVGNYVVLTAFFLVVLYPILYIIGASLSDPQAVVSGSVWLLPVRPTLDGYRAVFQYPAVWVGYKNAFIYMTMGTAINVALTILAAYPLSRKDYQFRRTISLLFVFTLMFNGGLIPTYMTVRGLGLVNTRWAMVLPTAIGVWNVIVTRTYFATAIPTELLESARIDGCTDFRFLASIVLPLSGPIIAVMCLFYAVHHWNSYFQALIYLTRSELYPLQLVLRDILIAQQQMGEFVADIDEQMRRLAIQQLMRYSLIIIASLPMFIIYPIVQKYFVKGIMIGSLKG